MCFPGLVHIPYLSLKLSLWDTVFRCLIIWIPRVPFLLHSVPKQVVGSSMWLEVHISGVCFDIACTVFRPLWQEYFNILLLEVY